MSQLNTHSQHIIMHGEKVSCKERKIKKSEGVTKSTQKLNLDIGYHVIIRSLLTSP